MTPLLDLKIVRHTPVANTIGGEQQNTSMGNIGHEMIWNPIVFSCGVFAGHLKSP